MAAATGVIFDESMVRHRCLWDPSQVEKPERFLGVMRRCRELDLIDRCLKLKPRAATEEEIATCHSQELIDFMKGTAEEVDVEVLKKKSARYT
jgi:histone deacetylase 6